MGTPYQDALASIAGGDAAPAQDDYSGALARIASGDYSSSIGGDQPPAEDDWWKKYWGHLSDQASSAYHAASNGDESATMPTTDPMTLTQLIANRAPYQDEIDAASDPNADADMKQRAALAAQRLARIDSVLSQMHGQGPAEPMTQARADDVVRSLTHNQLMASDRYRQVYDSTSTDMMDEGQRRDYACDTIAKEVSDLPYQRESILAQISGQDPEKALEMYGVDVAHRQDTEAAVPEPSFLQQKVEPGRILSGLGRAAASTEELAVKALSYLSPATMNNPELDAALDAFHKAFITDQDPGEAKNFGEALADAPGQALKIVAPALIAGPAGEAFAIPRAAAGVDALMPTMSETAWNAIAERVTTGLPGAVAASIPMAQDRYNAAIEQGATPAEAAQIVAQHAPADIAMNLMPVAAGGGTGSRMLQGGASQAALTAATEYAETGHVDPGQTAIAAVTGAALGGTHVAGGEHQTPADLAATRQGFQSDAEVKAVTEAHARWEGRFAKVLDAIGDDPEAKARADYALTQFNEGGKTGLWTMAELKHIAETGQTRDEAAYAEHQAALSPEAAVMGVTPDSAAQERASEVEAGQEIFGEPEPGMVEQRTEDLPPPAEEPVLAGIDRGEGHSARIEEPAELTDADLTPEERASFQNQQAREVEQPQNVNASGESAASAEAISRVRQEKDSGQHRAVIERDGSVRPVIGVDAVDTHARAGQVAVQRGVGRDEWTILSHGDDLTPDVARGRVNAAKPHLDELVAERASGHSEDDAEVTPAPRLDQGAVVPPTETAGARTSPEADGEAGARAVGAPVDIDSAAHAAETSPLTEGQPSAAKVQAGNYKKGHIKAQGLDITVENPRGSTRSGIGPDGRSWSRTMNHHYGYIRGTIGADGGHLDVLLGDQPNNNSRQVFVVDQLTPDGKFDEHKVLMGFRNQREAEKAYLSEYPKGWNGMGRVRAMTGPEFKTWTKGGGRDEARTGPIGDEVPRITLRHQQADAETVHASAPTEGSSVVASNRGGDGEPLSRLTLPNASMPSRRRVVLDEVPRGGDIPEGHGSAVMRNIYDLGRDPRNLMAKARAEVEKRGLPLDEDHVINEFERQVAANGFDGYRSEGKVAVLGHDVPVAKPEGRSEATESHTEQPAKAEGDGAARSEGEGSERDQSTEPAGAAGEGADKREGASAEKVAYRHSKTGPGMSKTAVRGLIKLLRWDGAKISVHQTEADLPARLRAGIEADGFTGRVRGLYDPVTGKVHIIADKMTSPRQLYRTLTEEHLGHGGLAKVFSPKELNQFLDRAWTAIPKSVRAELAKRYNANLSVPSERRIVAEEYLAKLDPNVSRSTKTLFEKFNDWFNAASRKMGRDVDYSPSELRAVMAAAHDHQRAGLSPGPGSKSPEDLVTPRNGLDGGVKVKASLDPSDVPEITQAPLKYSIGRVKGDADTEASMAKTMARPPEDMSLGDHVRRWLGELKGKSIRESWESAKQGWLDSGNQVARIEREVFGGFLGDASESPYKMYNLARNSHAVMAATMKLGVPEYRDGAFQPADGRKGIFEVFRPLFEHESGESLLPLWEFYAAGKRASRLIKETNITGTAREKNFDQQDIDRALALEKKYPVFKKVADDFQEFNNQLLDLAVDRGALDGEEAEAWKKNFYVPFYRAMEEMEFGGQSKVRKTKRGSAVSNQKIYSRRLTGEDARVDNVFENILGNTAYILDRTYRQEFMNRLLDMGEGVVLERVPMANKAVNVTAGDLSRALAQMGISTGYATHGKFGSPHIQPSKHWSTVEVDNLTGPEKAQWTKIFQRVAPTDPDVVPIMKNGKLSYYRVSDPLLLRTIGAMGHDSFGKIIGLLSGGKRLVTWGVTKDPGFMVATWFRDAVINWVGSHTPVVPFVDNAKGALASVRNDPLVSQLMMAGVGVAPHYETQGSTVRGQIERRFGKTTVVGTLKDGLAFYNSIGFAAEASSRLAIAQKVLDRGGSMAEAAYQAQDILNYSMRGDYVAARVLAATAPFWNAGMQGLYRFLRGAGMANAKAGDTSQLKSYMLRGSVVMAATLANIWRNQDDPRYNRLTNDDKDRYWHFWIGDEHFKLPKPFEAGVVFGTMPERIVQRMLGNDTTRDSMKAALTAIMEELRLNPFPQFIRQGIEQWSNRDTSSGYPIVPASMQDQLPQDQFSPYTHLSARGIANAVPENLPWLNSPKRVESLVRGITGTLGTYALDAADWLARTSGVAPEGPERRLQDYPVVKRFYGGDSPAGDRSQYEDKLYDLRATADATFQSFNEALKRGDADRLQELGTRQAFKYRPVLDEMARNVSVLRGAEKQIMQNPFIGPEEKRQQLDDANDARIKLLDQYAPLLNQLHDQF